MPKHHRFDPDNDIDAGEQQIHDLMNAATPPPELAILIRETIRTGECAMPYKRGMRGGHLNVLNLICFVVHDARSKKAAGKRPSRGTVSMGNRALRVADAIERGGSWLNVLAAALGDDPHAVPDESVIDGHNSNLDNRDVRLRAVDEAERLLRSGMPHSEIAAAVLSWAKDQGVQVSLGTIRDRWLKGALQIRRGRPKASRS